MKIMGFLGSPRVNGKCATLLKKALEGAESCGAETKQYDLIKCNIKICMGCGSCFSKEPERTIGRCPLKDDMAAILEDYLTADGYIYASPTYDMYVTALMKIFLERKIAFTFKAKDQAGKFPTPRPGVTMNFKKKVSIIITGNSEDVFKEVMCDPCVEAIEGDLVWEQIETLDTLYVGGVESITEETFAEKLKKAYSMGMCLTEDLRKLQQVS